MAGRHLLGHRPWAQARLKAAWALCLGAGLGACAPSPGPRYLGPGPGEGAELRAAEGVSPTRRQADLARLKAWEAARGPQEAAAIALWMEGPAWRPWLAEAQALHERGDRPAPGPGAALAARLLVACADAEAAASEARRLAHAPSPQALDPGLRPWLEGPAGPPEVAAVAGAAGEVLALSEPSQAEAWRRKAWAVARCAEAAGLAFPHEVEAAHALGVACAQGAWRVSLQGLAWGRPALPWPSLPPMGSPAFQADEAQGLARHAALSLPERAMAMALLKQEPSLGLPRWWGEGAGASGRALAEGALAAHWAIASATSAAPGLPLRPWPGLGLAGVEPLRPNPPGGSGPSAAAAGAAAYLGRLGPPPTGSPQAEAMASAVVLAAWSRPSEAQAGWALGQAAAQALAASTGP